MKVHLLRDLSYLSFSVTQLSYLSFLADGLHRGLHMTGTPFRRMDYSGVYTCPQMSSVHEQHLHCCGIVSCLV